MNLRGLSVLVFLFTLIGATGCDYPASSLEQAAVTNVPAAYATVAVILTETSVKLQTLSPTQAPPKNTLPAVPSTREGVPETTINPGIPPTFEPSLTATRMCDLAQAGVPIDVSIPDDSRLRPGETFVKTWRLVNAGACTWSHDYTVVLFSGDDLGVRREEPLNGVVAPGESVDLSVDMTAPEKPGVYQSNWKLRNPDGGLFGIGPGGGSPFWVRIQVVALDTPTPTTLAPTLTPTAIISSSGAASLDAGQSFDLDAGIVTADSDADFSTTVETAQIQLSPLNTTRIALYGSTIPSLGDCQTAALSTESLLIGFESVGRYLCLQTGKGLPGYLQIMNIDNASGKLDFQYVIWSVP